MELGEGCLASLWCQGCTNPSVQNRIKKITLFVLLWSDRVMINLINICFCAWTLSYQAEIFYSHIILVHISQILPIFNIVNTNNPEKDPSYLSATMKCVYWRTKTCCDCNFVHQCFCSTRALHRKPVCPAPTSLCPVSPSGFPVPSKRFKCSESVRIFSTGVLRHICEWIRLDK